MRLAIQRRVNSRERKLRVLPVILPGGERGKESDVPGFLQGTTWVEFRQSIDEADAVHRLACGIKGILPGRRPGDSIQQGDCPYIGLKTFQPEDAPLFFGRTAKIQELVDRLRNNFGTPKEERFLALIGASGSGKSSLALAGLIPAVQRGELAQSIEWPLVRCRPGARPWESLQIALAANGKIAPHLAALSAIITRPEDQQRCLHVTAQLALHEQPETHRLFVLIDQFEEIFTLCSDDAARRELIDNVLYATNVAGGRTIVVMTMRADFYGQCASYPGLRAAISDRQSLIGPLSEEELRKAIEFPAQLAGGELESGLMELLLADMKGQAGALPFLEHALFKLWEKRDGRRLTAKAYTGIGRLQGALDAHAEEFFTKILSTDEQALCRQVLVDLVHPGEGAVDTKKRVSLEDVAPTTSARNVLKKLADARLVTTSRDDRPEAAHAELAHEALISGWRRLGDWVNENREKSRLKERLLDSAREWQKNTKREDFLYRGAQLTIVEESLSLERESLPKLGTEFLKASIAVRDRERQKRQRNRQMLFAAVLAVVAVAIAAISLVSLRNAATAARARADYLATLITNALNLSGGGAYDPVSGLLTGIDVVSLYRRKGIPVPLNALMSLRLGTLQVRNDPSQAKQIQRLIWYQIPAIESPDQKYLLAIEPGRQVKIFKYDDSSWQSESYQLPGRPPFEIACSKGLDRIELQSSDGLVLLWDFSKVEPKLSKRSGGLATDLGIDSQTRPDLTKTIEDGVDYESLSKDWMLEALGTITRPYGEGQRPKLDVPLMSQNFANAVDIARQGDDEKALSLLADELERLGFETEKSKISEVLARSFIRRATEKGENTEQCFEVAQRLMPAWANTINGQREVVHGDKLRANGRVAEAEAAYRKAIEFDHDLAIDPEKEARLTP
jgi:energy-coupling factor transporter ATP-binding protein EcfA2